MIDGEFAIKILEQYREKPTLINEIETVEEAVWLDEALTMGIKALSQEPYEDVVSRECNNCAYYVNGANDEACDGCFEDKYEYPNFKPKAQSYEDCISRQAAIDRINKQREHLQPDIHLLDIIEDAVYQICAEFIELLPSAQSEIIECKDCKYRRGKPIADGRYWCNIHGGFMYYCSNAERRTDE